MNPGGSVKDRAALGLVTAAEDAGTLRPGGTVVEGTAGNTGIGLAHVCNARGYKLIICEMIVGGSGCGGGAAWATVAKGSAG